MFGPGTYAVPVNDVYLIIYNRDELVFKALLDKSYRVIEEVVIGSQVCTFTLCMSPPVIEVRRYSANSLSAAPV